MKLDESIDLAYNKKRKWENDHADRKSKRPIWRPNITCDVDVLQALTRESSNMSTQTRRGLHASRYPINCDPIDGVSQNIYMMQTRKTSCLRCLQGEPSDKEEKKRWTARSLRPFSIELKTHKDNKGHFQHKAILERTNE